MNNKIEERFKAMANAHGKVCDDMDELTKINEVFREDYAKYKEILGKLGDDVIEIDEQTKKISAELLKTMSDDFLKRVSVFNVFAYVAIDHMTKIGYVIYEIQDCTKVIGKLWRRMVNQRLDNAHCTKLLDNMETAALKTANEYFEFKTIFENAVAEFAEMRKGIENYPIDFFE